MAGGRNISHWLLTAPAFSANPLSLPFHTEIAILGAGIMGSALAYWLARHGKRPLVLERNTHPAGGATGRNGGLLVGGPNQPYQTAIEEFGREAAREIVQATDLNRQLVEEVLARESIQADYAQPGFLILAADSDEVRVAQASAQELKADGFQAEWLDRAAAQATLGTTLGPVVTGAYFDPISGTIHSARYTYGVAEAARRAGAYFAYSTPVERVEPGSAGRGWRVTTARGAVLADQVACTLNAWAGELFPELRQWLTPTRGHVVLTEPAGFRLAPWGANHGFEYGRQLEDGRLLVGGARNVRPDLELGHAPPPEIVEALRRYIPSLFPEAAELGLTHHWTGTMAFSPDGQPLAGRWPEREGLWLLAGFTGHGMPYSQVLPTALAAQIAGTSGPAIPKAFDPARYLA